MRRLALSGAVLLATVTCSVAPAAARPQYFKSFQEAYPTLKEQATTQKCGVCHCGKPKEGNNDYGAALKEALKAKNGKTRRGSRRRCGPSRASRAANPKRRSAI